MEIFDVFSMNGIENYPAAGDFFLENFILLKSHKTHFSPRRGHHFSRGAVKYPVHPSVDNTAVQAIYTQYTSHFPKISLF